MRHATLAFSVSLAATLSAGCAKPAPPAVPDPVVVEKAQAALAPFKASLRGELTHALADGPQAAVEVCARRAPEIARAASRDGITVGRSARKLRSRANAPREWLVPVMDRLAKAPSGSDAHEVVALPGGRRGYAEAIWTGAPCLLCHGPNVAPAVAEQIDQRYPSDAARGFEVGDLRGVLWAELTPEALGASAR